MEIRVLIFAEDSVSQKLYPILQNDELKVVGRTSDENKILDEITKTRADLVVISSQNTKLLLRVCQQVYLLRPKSTAIVLSQDTSQEMIQTIMQTGVHYILPVNIDSNAMVEQLKGIHSNETYRMSSLESASSNEWKSKVITVFSSKGGVGRTAAVTNLAIKLAQKKRKVAILDFDMEFGEVATSMQAETKNTIAELLQEQTTLNVDTIRKYMIVHPSGVNILAAPNSPEFADNISASQVERIISALRSYYDYLIIDTSIGFNNVNLSCFDASSSIFYITGMDVPTLRRTKKGLSIVNSLVGNEKVKLIIGKQEPSKVRLRDISRVLEFPLWHAIPFDHKSAIEAVNQGKPIVLDAPLSSVSKTYQKIANELDQSDSPKLNKEKKGLAFFKMNKQRKSRPSKS